MDVPAIVLLYFSKVIDNKGISDILSLSGGTPNIQDLHPVKKVLLELPSLTALSRFLFVADINLISTTIALVPENLSISLFCRTLEVLPADLRTYRQSHQERYCL